MRFILILLFLACPVFAAEGGDEKTKLPPDVQKVVDAHDAEVAKAKAAYDAAVAKANENGAKAMDAVVKARMAKQDLAGAVAAKAIVEKWKAEQPKGDDLLGEGRVTIVSAKYGVEDRWVDATKFLRSKIKDGNLRLLVGDDVHAVLGDPAGGQVKSFIIVYTLGNGEKKTASFAKGETINLGTPPQ